MEKKNAANAQEILSDKPCSFCDGFIVSKRNDGLFLLEMVSHLPQGRSVSSRTIMTLETMRKLGAITSEILSRENLSLSEKIQINHIDFKEQK